METIKSTFQLFNDDCLQKMKDLDDDSIDLILTDPPYNINHNNLEWDKIDNYIFFNLRFCFSNRFM